MSTIAEITAIKTLIFSYAEKFNSKDLINTVALYTDDGILMPNNAPLAKGQEQLKTSFSFLFNTFQINVEYTIDEVIISGDYAYARTRSKVKTFIIASKETIFLENKELFVLHKADDQWKISHYIFNNTNTTK